jgi:MFS transporter, DHA1 family, tetracycline resistance protein
MDQRLDRSGAKIGTARREAAFVFIFATILLDMLAMGIIIPVLPKLVVDFVRGDTQEAARIFGLFGTAFALMQFLFAPLQGILSDSFGRRPVILISNFGVGLDYVLMAMAPTLGWLFAGRVISGIASASIATAYAYVADVTPADRRAARFGLLGAAFGAGFVLGPALGGWAGSISPRLPFWIAAGLSLLNACYGFLILPESLPPAQRVRFAWRRANPFGAFAWLRSHVVLLWLSAVNFLGNLAHAVLPSVSVLYLMYRYGRQRHRDRHRQSVRAGLVHGSVRGRHRRRPRDVSRRHAVFRGGVVARCRRRARVVCDPAARVEPLLLRFR